MMTFDNYDRRVDRILEKADAEKKRRKKRRIVLSVLSSAAALLFALNLTLFVPYTVGGYDISAYEGSEYYALMDEIGSLACTKPRRTNNFDRWGLDDFFGGNKVDAEPSDDGYWMETEDSSPFGDAPDSPPSGERYEEVTNNQVKGVVEGDLLKRSDKYLYYLSYADARYHKGDVLVDENGEPIPDENGNKQLTPSYFSSAKLLLNIYTVSGEKVNTYEISDENPYTYNGYGERREMYLSEDCTKILILVPYFDRDAMALFTRVLGIDVSDPTSPREFARTSVSGNYVSSRLVGNTLLLVGNFTVIRNPDFAEEKQYLPSVDGEILPMEDIILPENPKSARYTVLTSFAADTLTVNASLAYFDFSEEVYVSAEHIFTTRTFSEPFEFEHEGLLGPAKCTRDMTEIACTSYDGMSLTYRGEVSAYGSTVDQYSLDEREGVLRVFTTGTVLFASYTYDTEKEDPLEGFQEPTCNLYCFDLSNFEQIAAVENFAPKGESVKSVRFDGDTAYVCTAVATYYEVTDPVFEFDLSDYDRITSKDTGTIPGYSLSLVKFVGDTLLGIGYGDGFNELKIEVYASDEEKVTSLCEFKLSARFSSEFKAYFIDAEHGLIGLQVAADSTHKSGYLLLRFDGYNLVELTTMEDVGTELDDARACLIDGTVYIFGYANTGECILKMCEV